MGIRPGQSQDTGCATTRFAEVIGIGQRKEEES